MGNTRSIAFISSENKGQYHSIENAQPAPSRDDASNIFVHHNYFFNSDFSQHD